MVFIRRAEHCKALIGLVINLHSVKLGIGFPFRVNAVTVKVIGPNLAVILYLFILDIVNTIGEAIAYISNGKGYTYATGYDNYYESNSYDNYDYVYIDPNWYYDPDFYEDPNAYDYPYLHNYIATKNDTVYISVDESYDPSIMLTGLGRINCFYGNNLHDMYSFTSVFANEDGLLYGVGNFGNLGGVVVDSTLTPTIIPIVQFDEKLEIINQNTNANNVISKQQLKITFNKELDSAKNISLYENGIKINLNVGYNINELIVSTPLGFVEGTNYRLVIPANTITGAGGVINDEDITINFTYGTFDEKVIHESVTDPEIERLSDEAQLVKDLNEYNDKTQINRMFYGNAVLNRISTDTDVTHWLRPLANSTAGVEIGLGGNWWGTTNERAIGLQLIDYSDFIDYGRFMYEPYLTSAPEDTFPFVTSVKVLNNKGEEVTSVGNEQITVQVTFNRDMDTSIPLQVRFGSAYPYGDYEIEGKYVDARTWEGKYKLTTIIENGIQYFTIENGCSATEDLQLMRDRARFSFEIDTTAAQALIMQGEATDTGIHLSWTQDDFDTLMGYNVYRSTSEDGLYVRVNSTVIPADTMEFFDDTVEPGVQYYYNFTVVQTDLSESAPSGKISIMSKDTMAPDIYHSPVYNATTGSNLVISATVTDNLNITYARVYYRIKGEEEWRVAVMNNLNDKYSAIIIADHITVDGLEYYIEAFDGVSYTYKGSAEAPYIITVQEVVSKDAMGDVNGDGAITNLDALMLLKAINDQLNLTPEQFARADLNGDGVLVAKEALCILQYVSGAIGSVDMREEANA